MNKLFAYPGGKWPIRHMIVSGFPEHTTYVDVFGGSAAVLITKEPSKGEVFNDKNEEIANFFRVVKHRPAELVERARHWIHHRKFWTDLRDTAPPVDELERAFRFWVLLADSFGGRGRHFGTSRQGVRSVSHAREYLDLVAQRLKGVHVESLEFSKCIRMYDSPETFFYLDPPYRGTTGGSSNYDLLSDDEWKNLHAACKAMKGKFLLSSNNDPFVVKLFRNFPIRTIDVRVMLPKSIKTGTRKEILASNYRLPALRKTHAAAMDADRPALQSKRKAAVRKRERIPS